MFKNVTTQGFAPLGGGVEHSPRKGFSDLFPSASGRGWHVVPGEGKKAFTLAEVLITLGIIGVVAVLTIPNLVTDYQSRSYNTAASNFERKLGEALRVMNTQMTLAGHNSTEEFVDELSRHMKIVNVCKGDKLLDCFEDKVMWGGGNSTPREIDMSVVKTSKNFGQKDWDETNIVGVQFANGTNAMIAYNKGAKQDPFNNDTVTITGSASKSNGSVSLGTDALAILYDTNGFKSPNHNSKDLRTINVRRLGAACALELDDLCITQLGFLPTAITVDVCKENRKALGIKYCGGVEYDYWAGAVKQCGHISNLPTSKQLAKIANYLYNTNLVNAEDTVGTEAQLPSLDQTKKSQLGISDGYFRLWTNEEPLNYNVPTRGYYNTYTNWGGSNRNMYGGHYAICIDK